MGVQSRNIGRYQVLNRLEAGGMGEVLLARDPAIERLIAIKLLREGFASADLRERFMREARSVGRVRHVNIVTIFDVGEHEGHPFIAMEYVEGETLSALMARKAAISIGRKIQLMDELCAGLAYAHGAGIVHRDIKPKNIMLGTDGVLKILDFGIARIRGISAGSETQPGVLMGTLNYIAPEQLMGVPDIDARADIFAAGAVFYELLTYRQAFPGDLASGILHKIIDASPEPILNGDPALDPGLVAIVDKCLEKSRDNRYRDMAAVRRDLAAVRRRLAVTSDDVPSSWGETSASPAPTSEQRRGVGSEGRQELGQLRGAQIRIHLEEAQRAVDSGDFSSALEAAERALLLDPANPDAVAYTERARTALDDQQAKQLLAEARAELDRGDLDAARLLVSRAEELSPASREAAALHAQLDEARRERVQQQTRVAPERTAPPTALDGTLIVPAPAREAPPPPLSQHAAAADHTVVFFATSGAPEAPADFPDVQLVVTRSPDPRFVGRTTRIAAEVFTIGRSAESDLNLPDGGWSRTHAEIRFDQDGFLLRDGDSTNGTYLNGRRVKHAPLLFGNVITIGQTDLTFSQARQTTLPDFTGCVIDNRYTLLRLLRESGRGAVYAARNERTSGDVAVKLLSPDLVRFGAYRSALRREAEIAARLSHPSVCSVIDYGPTTLAPRAGARVTTEYLCFKLMAGGSLSDRIEPPARPSLAAVAEWLAAIADALDYAHRHDVLHGDLKPSSIVFDDSDHPYLTDFSVAQQALNLEGRAVVGTPAYMAPELWETGTITPGADQFALAAIIYLAVTGSRAFVGQEYPEVRRKNFRIGPVAAHEEAAENGRDAVPRAVSKVLAQALATNPAQRFKSAAAFAAAFNKAVQHVMPREGCEVFISYQRDVSAPLAMYFADRLKAQGIHAFIDTQGIDRAGRFPPQIERAIEDTDVFICLLAATTLESDYVLDEIRAAHRFEKPMIPVLQESYRFGGSGADPAVAALLGHQGLPVLDRRNLHLDHSADDLVRLVKSAIVQRDRH